ncbi:MAG: signal peptidase I [Clostridia bacterium]|nr:signal peptidase I [Clostridia bacterium]
MFDWMTSFIIAVIFLCAVFTFGVRPVRVDGDSMLPTLQDGNWLIVSAFDSKPQQGEIVIVTQPNQTSSGGPVVKRIIAVGGQQVDINFEKGLVYVDGVLLDEPYILEKTHRSFDVKFPLTVPEGYLFVMGDNRNDSLDSRSSRIGLIDERYVLGSCVFRVYPFGTVED